MRRWGWLVVVAACGGGGGPVVFAEYSQGIKDAYCRYLTRCGEFPDVATCEIARTEFDPHSDPSLQAAFDMGTVLFDGDAARKCLDALGARSCDFTEASGRLFPGDCPGVLHGTVGVGGACALDAECKSLSCNVPTCSMACCQGTCVGDTPRAPGGPGIACMTPSDCASGNYCDFNSRQCAALKPAGATCQSTIECAYGFGCAGTMTRTCKKLPKLSEACPDLMCRDVGTYCNSAGTCAQVGLEGAACTIVSACGGFYLCDMTTMTCTQGPTAGQACGIGPGCFEADTFCDMTAAMPTCIRVRADGGACSSNSQCESNNCDQTGSAGMCTTPAVCI